MSLNTMRIAVSLSSQLSDAGALSTPHDELSFSAVVSLEDYSSGDDAGKANLLYREQIALTTGASVTRNLGDGSLKDALGKALTFTKLKVILVENASGVAATIGGGSNGVLTYGTQVQPGGHMNISNPGAGYTVDGTHSTLTLANSSGGTTVLNLVLVGVGARA